MVYPEPHHGEAGPGLLVLEMGLGHPRGIAYLGPLLERKMYLERHPGAEVSVILLQNQRLCLRLPDQGAVLHHPQSSTTSVLPPRGKEVDQNRQLNRRPWLGLPLDREVGQDLLKNLMGNPVHPLRNKVIQILLQILKLRSELRLGRGAALDHLLRLRAHPNLLLGTAGLAHPLKLKISQERHPGCGVVLIPLLNPKLRLLGLFFPDEADQVHQVKVEALPLKEAAVRSHLQSIPPNPELLEEALGPLQSPRPSLARHLVVAAPGRPQS